MGILETKPLAPLYRLFPFSFHKKFGPLRHGCCIGLGIIPNALMDIEMLLIACFCHPVGESNTITAQFGWKYWKFPA